MLDVRADEKWRTEPGRHEVHVGTSATDLPVSLTIDR